MKHEFKVGDKIRLTTNTLEDWHVVGETGVIRGDGEYCHADDESEEGVYFPVVFDLPDRDGDHECYARTDMMELADDNA